MKLLGATATDVGNVREANQDRAYFGGQTVALADGMGGHQGGERAAELAIGQFRRVTSAPSEDELVEIVLAANRSVYGHAADNGMPGMGTTLVALTLHPDDTITVANVGDSRAYWIRGDYMKRITDDHSFVEDLVRQGRLTPEEAASHPQRNILTRAVGIGVEVDVDRFPIEEPEPGDRFLLCSDGLFNEVSEDEILAIVLEAPGPVEAAASLIESALQTACRDNVTVAVVEVVTDDDPRLPADTGDEAADDLDDSGIITTEYPESDRTLPSPPPIRSDAGGQSEELSDPAGSAPVATMNPPDEHPVAELALADRPPQVVGDPVEAPAEGPVEQVRPRGRLAVAAVALVVVIALVVVAFFAGRWWATDGAHIGVDEQGNLAVFEGRDGGLFGLFAANDPAQPTDYPADTLTDEGMSGLLGLHFSDVDEAHAELVEQLDRAQDDQADSADTGPAESSDSTSSNEERSPSAVTELGGDQATTTRG